MGAWNTGIFDNDGALDAQGDLFEMLGIEQYLDDEAGDAETREERSLRWRAGLDERLPLLDVAALSAYRTVILAAMAMRDGAVLPVALREAASARLDEAQEGEGHFYDEARGDLERALADYRDGQPWAFREKGLLETMDERFAEGHVGLVNVPPQHRENPCTG